MNPTILRHKITLSLLAMLAVIACNFSVELTSPPEPTTSQEIQTEPGNTPIATKQPTLTAEVIIQDTAAAGSDASCTVLRDLFLRSGPGTAYRPAIAVLPANSKVTALGFAPQGLVGGTWAYVQDPATQHKGWISAAPQFISCNVDLATLPAVAFGLPQTYIPSTSQVSPGPGTCGEGGVASDNQVDVYDCSVVLSDGFPMQFVIFKNGQETGQADGIQNVTFSVAQNGNTIYSNTEINEAYCLFGGDGPCNYWVLEDYVYKWEAGGSPLESGTYTVSINSTLDDPSVNLFWSADVTVTVPE